MYLNAAALAHDDAEKRKLHKWVLYERVHSLSAGQIDWHESDWSDLKVCVIIDDASRMILGRREVQENQYREQQANCGSTCGKLLVNLSNEGNDHGSWCVFGAHRVHEDCKWDGDFRQHLERGSIKSILAKVGHPQTNG